MKEKKLSHNKRSSVETEHLNNNLRKTFARRPFVETNDLNNNKGKMFRSSVEIKDLNKKSSVELEEPINNRGEKKQ